MPSTIRMQLTCRPRRTQAWARASGSSTVSPVKASSVHLVARTALSDSSVSTGVPTSRPPATRPIARLAAAYHSARTGPPATGFQVWSKVHSPCSVAWMLGP